MSSLEETDAQVKQATDFRINEIKHEIKEWERMDRIGKHMPMEGRILYQQILKLQNEYLDNLLKFKSKHEKLLALRKQVEAARDVQTQRKLLNEHDELFEEMRTLVKTNTFMERLAQAYKKFTEAMGE